MRSGTVKKELEFTDALSYLVVLQPARVSVTQTHAFIILLMTRFGPDRPSSGD
jgi:hypothetical protein